MNIELQGGPMVKVLDLEKLNKYLKLDDIILNMMEISQIGACPILSLNVSRIEKEGKVPYGHIETKIGKERYKYLIDNKIIEIFKK